MMAIRNSYICIMIVTLFLKFLFVIGILLGCMGIALNVLTGASNETMVVLLILGCFMMLIGENPLKEDHDI